LAATTVTVPGSHIAESVGDSSKKKVKKLRPEALEVVVLGLSHHNAGVDVRERLAVPEDNWNQVSRV